MNKNVLIDAVREAADISKKEAGLVVSAVFCEIEKALSVGDKVSLIGFGTFEVRERAARKARNPQTGELVEIPAAKAPAFKAGKTLKDAVNK